MGLAFKICNQEKVNNSEWLRTWYYRKNEIKKYDN